jgi:hypothetical protein
MENLADGTPAPIRRRWEYTSAEYSRSGGPTFRAFITAHAITTEASGKYVGNTALLTTSYWFDVDF